MVLARWLNFSGGLKVGSLKSDQGSRMNRKLSLSLAAALGLVVVAAYAQPRPGVAPDAPGDAALRAAVIKSVPGVVIDSIKPSVIPGYKEVAIGGRVVYVSNDGKYLIQGSLMELSSRDNLTSFSEGALRRDTLNAVGRERRIIFSPAKPKYRLTVFTDIDCGYCRKMHTQIADYNKAGISVEYLFFPRAGLNSESFNKAVSVWCSNDRQKALTDAKADRPVPKKTCANPIAQDYELGKKIGVDGTPAVYGPDGTQLGGYLPPAEVLAKLNRQAARVAGK
jgi:thiol:disulfide interchange protein DsbC